MMILHKSLVSRKGERQEDFSLARINCFFSREKHSPPVVSVGLQGFEKRVQISRKSLKIAHLWSEYLGPGWVGEL